MLKRFIFIILIVPAIAYSYDIQTILGDLKGHIGSIQSLKANFTLDISGTGKNPGGHQHGIFTYVDSVGTTMEYDQPTKIRVDMKNDGSLYINGVKKTGITNSYQPGDIYFLYYLNNFDLKIDREDTNYVFITGYQRDNGRVKTIKPKALNLRFQKALKVIDFIRYLGSGNDYPYEINAKYIVVNGVPVMNDMDTLMSAFSITVRSTWKMSNIEVVKK